MKSSPNALAKILAIGDSYVAGFGVRKEACWVAQLDEIVDSAVINYGQNGAWITELADKTYPIDSRDIVLVLGGCNDLLDEMGAEDVNRAYLRIQRECRDAGAHSLILLPPMPSLVSEEPFASMSNMVSLKGKLEELYTVAEGLSLNDVIREDPALFLDGIHLVERGHGMIARAVLNALKMRRWI